MSDRFFHPDGKKAQDIQMRGGKLVKKTGGDNPTVAESIRKRNEMLEEAYGASGGVAGRTAQKKTGVSGYKTPKGQVEEGLNKAGSETPTEEEQEY